MQENTKQTRIKTVEFKLYPTLAQKQQLGRWLDELRWVWNQALEALFEYQQFKWYAWAAKKCDMDGVELVSIRLSKRSAWLASCPIFGKDGKPIEKRQLPESPRLLHIKPKGGLGKLFTMTSLNSLRKEQELPPLTVPSKFMSGLLQQMSVAWSAYLNPELPDRHRLRFKSKKHPLSSLYCFQPESIKLNIQGDRVSCPGVKQLGTLKTKGLERWTGQPPRSLSIVEGATSWYLHLTGEFEYKKHKPTAKPVGIDPGVKSAVCLDNGREYKPANPLRKKQQRLKRLSRKLARQIEGSANWKKTQSEIAKLHERVRFSRKAFNHQLSSKIVAEYGNIAIENTNLKNMTRKAKPKPKTDGTGYEHNGAKAKSGLNRALADVAIGQLRAFIESKALLHDRVTARSHAPHSSRRCHCCGIEGRRKQKIFQCLNPDCSLHGQVQDADANAGKNHLLNSGLLHNATILPAWAGSLPVERLNAALSVGDAPTGEASQVSAIEVKETGSDSRSHGGEKSPRLLSNHSVVSKSGKSKRRIAKKLAKSLSKPDIKKGSASLGSESHTQLDFLDALLQSAE